MEYNTNDQVYVYLYLTNNDSLMGTLIKPNIIDKNGLANYQQVNGKYTLTPSFALYSPAKIIDKRLYEHTVFYCLELEYNISLPEMAYALLKPRRQYRNDSRAENPKLMSLIEMPDSFSFSQS